MNIQRHFACVAVVMVACGGLWTTASQGADCQYYRVHANSANVSKEPRPDAIYIDLLDKDEIVCVTRTQKTGEADWAYIPFKVPKPGEHTTVDGWVGQAKLEELSPDEVATATGEAAPSRNATRELPPRANTPREVAPRDNEPRTTQRAAKRDSARNRRSESRQDTQDSSGSQDEILRYTRPLPFGAYPVIGNSIEQLAKGVPEFPPIEGLPESLWKKHCSNCHQWERSSLCTQAKTYAKNPRSALRHPHPFGGVYKSALMQWAKGGCQ